MLVLKRLPEYLGVTPGHIFYDAKLVCSCLELPWRDNIPLISCIPAATYQIIYSYSPKLKVKTIEILDVPGRTGIRGEYDYLRAHSANRVQELLGCIAPCTDLIIEAGEVVGRSSKLAVEKLEALVIANKITELRIESSS